MDQLRRETQPPAGTPPSPVPQYWNPDTEKYERVLGAHGAPRAMLYGPNGQPISTSNRLPVDVGAQVATESTLAEAVSRLNAILTRLEGTLNVDVGGQIHADVDLGDVTVQIGEVQQGKRGQNAEPWEVTLSGRTAPEIETIINAQSVPAGGNTGFVLVDFKGCRKAILGLICDKKWRLHVNSLWGNVSHDGLHIYPDVSSSDQEAWPSFNYPRQIVVGYGLGQSAAGTTSLAQALQMAELPNNLRIQVENRSEETMTVTVRLMRIW